MSEVSTPPTGEENEHVEGTSPAEDAKIEVRVDADADDLTTAQAVVGSSESADGPAVVYSGDDLLAGRPGTPIGTVPAPREHPGLYAKRVRAEAQERVALRNLAGIKPTFDPEQERKITKLVDEMDDKDTLELPEEVAAWIMTLPRGPERRALTKELLADHELDKEVARLRRQKLAKEIVREEEAASEALICFTSGAERADRPEVPHRIENIAPTGACFGVWWGASKSRKTGQCLDLALSLANGLSEWMGLALVHDEEQPDVIYVLGEGVSGFPKREKAWLAEHPGCNTEHLHTVEKQTTDLTTKAGLDRLLKSIRATGLRPSLIVYDTQGLTCADGVDENSRTDMRAVYANLKHLADELACLVITVTHPGNDAKTQDRPSGASSQKQDADLAISFRYDAKDNEGIAWVHKTKDVGVDEWGWTYSARTVAGHYVLDHQGFLHPDDTDANAANSVRAQLNPVRIVTEAERPLTITEIARVAWGEAWDEQDEDKQPTKAFRESMSRAVGKAAKANPPLLRNVGGRPAKYDLPPAGASSAGTGT